MDVAHAPPPLPPEPSSNHFSEPPLPAAHDAPPLPADDEADAPPLPPPEEPDEPAAGPSAPLAERQPAEPGAEAGAGPGSANGAPLDLLTAELDPEEDPLLVAEARRAAEGEAGEGPPAEEPMWPAEDPDAVKLSTEEEEALLKGFFAEVREVDRANEVNRILGAFKLNPFEQLGLRFDATLDEAKRQYRKASLLVHPDKCSHPHATSAFEVLGHANQQLQSEEVMHELRHVLTLARDELRRDRKKKTKNDATVRLASLVHKEGREGVEAEWERSNEFHEAWKLKARDMLARAEWRRRKLTKRLKEEEERIEEDEADTRKRLKTSREHHKKWEETRETRVGTWRDFAKKKGKKGTHMMGGLKPPKQKEWDEEHTYIQRPVGEQHRPPPQKPAGPQGGPPPPKPPQPQRR